MESTKGLFKRALHKNGIENEVLIGKLCQIEQYASINPYFIGLV